MSSSEDSNIQRDKYKFLIYFINYIKKLTNAGSFQSQITQCACKEDQCTINHHVSANRRPRTGVKAPSHILNILKSMEYKKPWSYLDKTDVTHKINKIHSFTFYPDSAQYTLTGEALWIEKSVYSQEKRNIWWERTFHSEFFPSGPCQPRIPFVWRKVLRKEGGTVNWNTKHHIKEPEPPSEALTLPRFKDCLDTQGEEMLNLCVQNFV